MAADEITRRKKRQQEIDEYDHNFYARFGRSRPLTIEEEDQFEEQWKTEVKEVQEFFTLLFYSACILVIVVVAALVLYHWSGDRPL